MTVFLYKHCQNGSDTAKCCVIRVIRSSKGERNFDTFLRCCFLCYGFSFVCRWKQIVGTSQFTRGMDLDKLRGIAQDNTKWAYLVKHITSMMRVSWVTTNCTRKQQEVPWSSTPIIRVRPADARIPRRAALPRDVPRLLLAFDETPSSEDTIY